MIIDETTNLLDSAKCDICCEIAGSRNSLFHKLHPALENRCLYNDNNFYVTPSLKPITFGHLLVWTKSHHRSFSAIDKTALHQLEHLIDTIVATSAIYDNYLLFEHGVESLGGSACGITHAHIHILPVPSCDVSIPHVSSEMKSSSLVQLKQLSSANAYIFVRGSGNIKYCVATDDTGAVPFISQYVRGFLASSLGRRDVADWRFADPGDREVEDLVGTFKKIML